MACQWEGAAVVQRAGISQRTAVRPGLHSSQWDLSEQARRSVPSSQAIYPPDFFLSFLV